MSLTIGSLFSGVGGIELGIERAGLGPTLWQVEQDPFCRRVLAKHWPEATRYEDVREVGAHNLEPVDLLCGGFPCQDISSAGRGVGIEGARSGLWSELARVIRELEPRWVVVENVPTLTSRGLDRVLGDLAAGGYDAVWDCLPAAAVGAPHRRDRLFVVARRASDAKRDRVRDQSERRASRPQAANSGHAEPSDMGAGMADTKSVRRQKELPGRGSLQGEHDARTLRENVADRDGIRLERQWSEEIQPVERGHADGRNMSEWPPAPGDMHAWGRVPAYAQPAICRLADGLPAELDWARGRGRRPALKAYGNAVVPAVAEVIGRALVAAISTNHAAEVRP